MILARRRFLIGLVAAPLVVRSGILMPVKTMAETILAQVAPTFFTGDIVANADGDLIGVYWGSGKMKANGDDALFVDVPPGARQASWSDLGYSGSRDPFHETPVSAEKALEDAGFGRMPTGVIPVPLTVDAPLLPRQIAGDKIGNQPTFYSPSWRMAETKVSPFKES